MPKLVQICASQNDLFGLDDAGTVYRYNFNTSSWVSLDDARSANSDRTRPAEERIRESV